MKNSISNIYGALKVTITLFFLITFYHSGAQHIQYRHKLTPVAQNKSIPEIKIPVPDIPIPVPVDPVILVDTPKTIIISRAAVNENPRPKKKYVEEQNMCNLLSLPELAPKLPVIINNVSDDMVRELKERYAGRLYSITKLNMIDERLKYKLKICDRDNGKFRSEFLDKDGAVINDPDLDYD